MRRNLYLTLIFMAVALYSCKKGWMDAKPNKSLVIPSNIKDYQALLDNTSLFNTRTPALGEISADNYYLQYSQWQSLANPIERNAYLWEKDLYNGMPVGEWDAPYGRILNANIVLEGIDKINPKREEIEDYNNVKGSALFFRSFDFLNLLQLFAKPYNSTTADVDQGIPLRLQPDVVEKSTRATVQECYNKVIIDLLNAKNLLTIYPTHKTRPSKQAVFALLSRTYLFMDDYDKALAAADSCLELDNFLIEYSQLDYNGFNTFKRFNGEVIFHSTLSNYSVFSPLKALPDSTLLSLYNVDDLRLKAFYKPYSGSYLFSGSYDGSFTPFGGIATDEIYLIKAECQARKGDKLGALSTLNILLQTRYQKETFTPVTANSSEDALKIILDERRKELVFRGLRWSDLRRLNSDDRFATSLTRIFNGEKYTLLPDDPKYVLPIPDEEIQLSGIHQNSR